MSEQDEGKFFGTPEGRLINGALYERDIYTDAKGNEGAPKYNVEMAFQAEEVTGEGDGTEAGKTLEDRLYEYADEKWGEGSGEKMLAGDIRSPLLDGDKLAAKREKRGKTGDAYKGKIVVRAHTLYNKHGDQAPGGIKVWNPDMTEEVDLADRENVYNGSMGAMRLSIGDYENSEGDPCLMFYLSAYQYRGAGERLMSVADTASAFKPVLATAGGKRVGRKSARG